MNGADTKSPSQSTSQETHTGRCQTLNACTISTFQGIWRLVAAAPAPDVGNYTGGIPVVVHALDWQCRPGITGAPALPGLCNPPIAVSARPRLGDDAGTPPACTQHHFLRLELGLSTHRLQTGNMQLEPGLGAGWLRFCQATQKGYW